MALSPRMGLRVDCLGEFNMFSLIPTSPVLQERWRTAPVLSEWCATASTSPALGAQQVRQYHISQVASPNARVEAVVAADPTAMAAFVDAAKSSGYRYVLSKLRLPTRLPRTGPFTVRSVWRNDGSAPTYDDWRVTVQLRKRGNVGGVRRPRCRPAHGAARHQQADHVAGPRPGPPRRGTGCGSR